MNEKQKQAFLDAYSDFKEMQDWMFSIEIYHNDESSEPFICTQVNVERILLDYVEDCHFVITFHTEESVYSFSSKNWLAHVGSGYVSFGSTYDEGTHCIIQYC